MSDQTTNILFVCTGNTCRSPMAVSIARHLLARNPGWDGRARVFSAGVGAVEGASMTAEAQEALERIGVARGDHRSIAITGAMLAGAQHVFGMTSGHVASLRAMAPEAAGRISTLDPESVDIADPIGGPQSLYDETARSLLRVIEGRLKEILG